MLKTVVLLNIFVETDIFSGLSEDRKQFLIYKNKKYDFLYHCKMSFMPLLINSIVFAL